MPLRRYALIFDGFSRLRFSLPPLPDDGYYHAIYDSFRLRFIY